MTKRSEQTTGRPREGRSTPAAPQPAPSGTRLTGQPRTAREYRTRAEREAQIQRYVVIGVAAAAIIATVILVIAIVIDQVIVPQQAVANVNGETITVADFQKRVRLERALLGEQINEGISLLASFGFGRDQIIQQISQQPPYSTWLSELQVPDQLGNRVLNEMIDNVLVKQQAETMGITVSDDDVQAQIQQFFNFDPEAAAGEPTPTPEPSVTPTPFVSPTPSPEPTSTPTPEMTPTASVTPMASATPLATPDATQRAQDFETSRNDFFGYISRITGLSEADIRVYFEEQALRAAVSDAQSADMSNTAPFVQARHILVGTQAEATEILAALEAGESFAMLAQTLSTDSSAPNGGELDWAPISRYVKEFADAVRDAEIGAYVGPISTQFGYHVVQVRAREDREMSDSELSAVKENEFDAYVETLRADANTSIEIYDIWSNNVPTDPVFVPRGL